jgi:hypothetical protein
MRGVTLHPSISSTATIVLYVRRVYFLIKWGPKMKIAVVIYKHVKVISFSTEYLF